MKRYDDKKYIEFDDDDDFTNYAIHPHYVFKTSPEGTMYYDVDFTDEYLKDVDNGFEFDITCDDSAVRRRQTVTFGIISKPVKICWN